MHPSRNGAFDPLAVLGTARAVEPDDIITNLPFDFHAQQNRKLPGRRQREEKLGGSSFPHKKPRAD